MSDRQLMRLARRLGIAVAWDDAFGKAQVVGVETLRAMIEALGYAAGSPAEIADSRRRADEAAVAQRLLTGELGQTIEILGAPGPRCRFRHETGETVDADLTDMGGGRWTLPPLPSWGYWTCEAGGPVVAIAPPRCFAIEQALGRGRAWGLAAQIYSLRRPDDCGVGNFAALADLARGAAAAGADMLAVSPAHAMFAARPGQYSPYSPSNRLLLNWSYGDAVGLCRKLGAPLDPSFAAQRERIAASTLIDWPRANGLVAQAMRAALAHVSAHGGALADSFARFRAAQGSRLEAHACFEALQAHAASEATDDNWWTWPSGMRDPHGAGVADFAARRAAEISFHTFAQWCVHEDRAATQAACRAAGMGVGLVADLAVGVDPAGSQVWAQRDDFLKRLSIGAPPDLFNLLGQSWGLAALSPRALGRTGFAPFIDLLRAVFRDAGGVRIDHILGFRRLWLVPHGMDAANGAYLAYPLADLLRLLKIESWRHRAIVIGEDLGTVPPGFRRSLAAAGVLGTQVLWFEREADGAFRPPQRWSRRAIGMSTTHDLPTVAGWWQGHDVALRRDLSLFPTDEDATRAAQARESERPLLWQALCDAGVASGAMPAAQAPEAVVGSACAFLGRTRAPLALLPLEDALATDQQPNLPGTIDAHPNWRRRFAADASGMLDDPSVVARLRAVGRRRKRSPAPRAPGGPSSEPP